MARARGDHRKRYPSVTTRTRFRPPMRLGGRTPRAAWIILFYRSELRQFLHGELAKVDAPASGRGLVFSYFGYAVLGFDRSGDKRSVSPLGLVGGIATWF